MEQMEQMKLIARTAERILPRNAAGDVLYSVAFYCKKNRRIPRLWRPRTFNEKMLALKLSNASLDPLRQFVTDKEFVKDFVRARASDKYNVETFAVFDSLDQLRDFEWPADCVIKPTHSSREVIIRRNRKPDVPLERLTQWLGSNYYRDGRERNYRFLRPKIIVERLLLDEDGELPYRDYKIFCFFGKPKFVQVDIDRFGHHRRGYYSLNWKKLPFSMNYPQEMQDIARPAGLDDMLELASKLAEPLGFIRVDLYAVGEEIKVGELTSWAGNCVNQFTPPDADLLLGRLFDSPEEDVEALFGPPRVA
jgi:hypothetical protein